MNSGGDRAFACSLSRRVGVCDALGEVGRALPHRSRAHYTADWTRRCSAARDAGNRFSRSIRAGDRGRFRAHGLLLCGATRLFANTVWKLRGRSHNACVATPLLVGSYSATGALIEDTRRPCASGLRQFVRVSLGHVCDTGPRAGYHNALEWLVGRAPSVRHSGATRSVNTSVARRPPRLTGGRR